MVAATGHGGSTTDVKEISAGPALLNGTTNIESVIAKVLPAVVSIDATSPAPSTGVASSAAASAAAPRRTRAPG